MDILVIGAGAMGGYFGAHLMNSSNNVDFLVKPEQLSLIRENGLLLESTSGAISSHRVNAFSEKEIDYKKYDVIFITVKDWALEQVGRSIHGKNKKGAVIATVQNGMGYVDTVKKYFDHSSIVFTIPMISASVFRGGHIRYHDYPNTVYVGSYEEGKGRKNAKLIHSMLNVQGVTPVFCENIGAAQWAKLSAHCGASLFCMTRSNKSAVWSIEHFRSLYYRAVEEAVEVATASGINVDEVRHYQKGILADNLPPNWKPSTLTSLEKNKPTEINSLNGFVCAKGKQFGVPTPVNEVIYNSVISGSHFSM